MHLALTLTLPAAASRGAGGGLGTFYANTAFVSTAGDDNTAVLGYASRPYETMGGALAALDAEYPGEETQVRFLNSVDVGTVDVLDHLASAGRLILRGHSDGLTISGTLTCTGSNGDPPGAGFDVALWNITLATYDGSGGDAEGVDQDGGNGGDAYLIGDAAVTSFTSDGGAGSGAGATGAAGRERIVALDMDGEPQRNMDGTFATLMS
jgi:hypothetical protein